ncbi:MAG: hypothetical protein ABW140_04355, partial [Candidatus Sedimenticola sp. 6PFRAG1]
VGLKPDISASCVRRVVGRPTRMTKNATLHFSGFFFYLFHKMHLPYLLANRVNNYHMFGIYHCHDLFNG